MVFQFKIELSYITDPVVWRRVAVPAQFTFYKFHRVIQEAFGWKDYHLFQFIEFERSFTSPINIGMPQPEFDDEHISPAKKIKLSMIFPNHQKLKYVYDFGDTWEHIISLEKTDAQDSKHAWLLSGEGACPPEDCGGPPGYQALKEILRDPKGDEYEDMRQWLGLKKKQRWDAAAFNHEKTKASVAKI